MNIEIQPIETIAISPRRCKVIPHANLEGYFKRLVGMHVDQKDALKLVFDCKERIEDPSLPIDQRINTVQAVNTAAETLPKKLKPAYETVSTRK